MAMIAFLERLPLWLLAIVLNAWLMGTVLVGLWIFRRHVLPRLESTSTTLTTSPRSCSRRCCSTA